MNSAEKLFAGSAALLMAVAVMLGALGAHALESVLEPAQLESFNSGVRYHAWHAMALLLVQLLPVDVVAHHRKLWVSRLLFAGIVCFSFSIYLLNLRYVLGIEAAAKFLGPITPIGGLLFIGAWSLLALSIFRSMSVTKTL